MRPLVPPAIASLHPYVPGLSAAEVSRVYGLSEVIKLASNENPLGPSPLAVEAIHRSLGNLHLYPSGGLELREVLSRRHRTKTGNVIAGSGSESIMSNIIRTFLCDDDEVLTTEPTFIGFRVLAMGRGVRYRSVPCRKDWSTDLSALANAITERTKIIYLANPNNPTGTIFTREEFDQFYTHVPERVLIILDEAYFEYAQHNADYPDSLRYRYDNVITLRTFSKVYGLAGLRIGYGFAHEDLIANLMKVKLPFEPSTVAQAAAIAALEDKEHLERTLRENARSLALLTNSLPKFGFEVAPSEANFVLVAPGEQAEAQAIYQGLLRQGIIVRSLSAFGLPGCLRVSTGTLEQTERLVEAITAIAGVQNATLG
jgi:histidinol-phosphate aminotransferase